MPVFCTLPVFHPVDACPGLECDPASRDACLPLCVEPLDAGGVLGSYECSVCGTAWQTPFDAYGWLGDRLIALVSPVEAEQHRDGPGKAMRGEAA
jgi:hypothetical protein